MTRPTRAQRNVLICAERGEISHSTLAAHALGYSPWYGSPEHKDVIERVIAKGWARLGRTVDHYAPLELTDAGREALQPSPR